MEEKDRERRRTGREKRKEARGKKEGKERKEVVGGVNRRQREKYKKGRDGNLMKDGNRSKGRKDI